MPIGRIETEADLERFIAQRLPALVQREGNSVLLWGKGAPSGAPSSPRALWVQLDGGPGSVLHVWDGGTWTAFA